MDEESVVDLWAAQVVPHDFIIVVLKDEVDDETLESILEGIDGSSSELEVTMVLLRESEYANAEKLSLTRLVALQERIESAIIAMSTRDVKGEA